MHNRKFPNVMLINIMLFCFGIAYAQSSLITIKYKAFDKPIDIDNGFKKYTEIMNGLALMNDLKIIVQQAFRKANEEVENAIVVPVKTSNHLVGHAMDINIEYGGILYNSKLLKNYDLLPENIKIFIIGCRISKIRWGGDLKINDSVHFDDNLYEINNNGYEELYRMYQK
jgi:hypothetical protein